MLPIWKCLTVVCLGFFFPEVLLFPLLVPQQVLLTVVVVNSTAKNGGKGQELQEMEGHNSDSTKSLLSASGSAL